MVSSFTPNINLEEPARGDDPGTWDTPVNNNMTLIDLVVGAATTVGLGSGNLTLSAAQFKSASLTFNSTLIQNTTVTFPSTFIKPYIVGHTCTGSSAFTITLQTTVSGGQVIALPPGEFLQVFNDGTNLKFGALGRVGDYWDHAGSSVPGWVSACTVPPYLACTGGTFSSSTYPQLAMYLGGTTLPDSRGRARYALDAGVNRVSSNSSASGIQGNTLFAGGGDQMLQSHGHTASVTDPGHSHTVFCDAGNGGAQIAAGGGFVFSITSVSVAQTGVTVAVSSFGAGSAQNMPPMYVGGITMIRAA